MAEQVARNLDPGAGLDQPGGEGVPQVVEADMAEAARAPSRRKGPLHARDALALALSAAEALAADR